MSDTELDAMIVKLSEWDAMEHPGIRAGKLLAILREFKDYRQRLGKYEMIGRACVDYKALQRARAEAFANR